MSSSSNSTNSFIELFNAGNATVDLSNWTLTQHGAQQASFSAINVPAATKLPAGGFYVFGLATSGLTIPALALITLSTHCIRLSMS